MGLLMLAGAEGCAIVGIFAIENYVDSCSASA